MSRKTPKMLTIWGTLMMGGLAQSAFAQWSPYDGGCGCSIPQVPYSVSGPSCSACAAPPQAYSYDIGCAPPPIACAPPPVACAPPPQIVSVQAIPVPQPVVQIQQPQFTWQPVTETKTVENIVQKPVYETKYVDVPHTEYRQEVEMRYANVPTVNYQTVTQMQTRQRDVGQWVTRYRCRPYVNPQQYDCRPGWMGAMNRQMYKTRMSMTPAVVAERTYCPKIITEQIPVTRQVAVPSQQQVAYKITKMVPVTSTRKVAVQEVRMVAEKVQQNVQVTTMRMVPLGNTATAFGGNGTTGTAFGGNGTLYAAPDPNFGPTRTATRDLESTINNNGPVTPAPPPIKRPIPDALKNDDAIPGVVPQTQMEPAKDQNDVELTEQLAQVEQVVHQTAAYRGTRPIVETVTSEPSVIVVGKWMPRKPSLGEPEITVAAAAKKVSK